MRDRIILAAVAAVIFGPLLLRPVPYGTGLRPQTTKRNYHAIAIADLTGQNPADWTRPLTHIQVTGWVRYVKHEEDGDTHIRICDDPKLSGMDTKHCIVAECIPELPCKAPKVGEQITVEGIGRFDAERPGHHWWECHPVEKLASGNGLK